MKNRSISKKFLVTLLAVIMLVGTLYVPASAKGFSDISSSHPSLDAINYVSDNAIMAGTSSTMFSPNTEVTRGMVVTVLYQKAGAPAVSGTNKFTDVSSSAYYYKAVLWASTNGIAGGTSSTTFSPNNKITRQDTAVMLYKLGNVMHCSDMAKTTDITGCFDYSSVSPYARTAVAWACATEVIPADSGYLHPTHTVTRAQLAEFVTTFGTNAEKIISGKDNLGFINYTRNEKRYITAAHRNKLFSLVRAYYGSTNGESSVNALKDRLEKNCTGMCYGMSVVTMLDKMGKIAFNENYSDKKNMFGIKSAAVNKTKAESAITYYHVSSSLPGHKHRNYTAISGQVDKAGEVMLNSNIPSLLEIYYNRPNEAGVIETYGHEIIVNSCRKSGTSYILNVIDPNNTTGREVTLTAGGMLGTTQLISINADNAYSVFDKIDIDGYHNKDTSSSAQSLSANTNELSLVDTSIESVQYPGDFSTLEIELTGDFVVHNEEGESLQWDGINLTGDMETYDVRLSPEGNNSPAIMFVDVPISNHFYFESLTDKMEVWFSVADQYRYSRVSGTDMTAISIDENGKIDIDGTTPNFEVAYGAPQENSPLLNLSGTGFGSVTTEVNGDRMQASGNIKDYVIKSFDFEGNLMYDEITSDLQVGETTDILQDSSTKAE